MKDFLRFRFNDLNKSRCSYSWCVCGGEGRGCAEQSEDEGVASCQTKQGLTAHNKEFCFSEIRNYWLDLSKVGS